MATFLTNAKMSPELAARVDASVRGRRSRPGDAAAAARFTAIVRLVLIVAVVGGVGSLIVWRRGEGKRIDRDRAALLDTLHAQGASITREDRSAVTRIEPWLSALAGPYEGDLVVDRMREPGVFGSVLARPIVYVHGPTGAFKTPVGIAGAATASVKDSFLLCLVAPPASRTEREMSASVRAVYAGGALLPESTGNVARLADAQAGLRVLSPEWEARVRAADDDVALGKLRTELERAPLEKAKQALKAEYLVVVMDETGTGSGPSELDGERPHDVRVAIVDLGAGRVLLRTRKHVDPSAWSVKGRTQWAIGLDECALAIDVRALSSAP